jgi:hypothetical protein
MRENSINSSTNLSRNIKKDLAARHQPGSIFATLFYSHLHDTMNAREPTCLHNWRTANVGHESLFYDIIAGRKLDYQVSSEKVWDTFSSGRNSYGRKYAKK